MDTSPFRVVVTGWPDHRPGVAVRFPGVTTVIGGWSMSDRVIALVIDNTDAFIGARFGAFVASRRELRPSVYGAKA